MSKQREKNIYIIYSFHALCQKELNKEITMLDRCFVIFENQMKVYTSIKLGLCSNSVAFVEPLVTVPCELSNAFGLLSLPL